MPRTLKQRFHRGDLVVSNGNMHYGLFKRGVKAYVIGSYADQYRCTRGARDRQQFSVFVLGKKYKGSLAWVDESEMRLVSPRTLESLTDLENNIRTEHMGEDI